MCAAMLLATACGSEVIVAGVGGGDPAGGTGASGASNGSGTGAGSTNSGAGTQGPGSSTGPGTPGGGGVPGSECTEDSDCPAPPFDICSPPICDNGVCDTTWLPENTPCDVGALCTATGHCELIDGESCVMAQYLCHSGPCVDGVCCATPCQGVCESCNQVGNEGVCLPVISCSRP
jgi:hypothetical protein